MIQGRKFAGFVKMEDIQNVWSGYQSMWKLMEHMIAHLTQRWFLVHVHI